ncbi:MAG: glucose-1-phosphate thymidylyltransferase RfbA [Thermodesulfobacteriota bacterium]
MKGIILAGGLGTRLYPITKIISKQLLPIYDKPMIYYPLSVLMLSGIKDILIISTKEDLPKYELLFNNGSDLGLKINYAEQDQPNGLAEAFIIGEQFIGEDNVCLILGDNIFFGNGLTKILGKAANLKSGALIFGYNTNEPERYGVLSFDNKGKVTGIEEKPKVPKSKYAVTGLYYYDNTVIEKAKNLHPSDRGELEITDLNITYLKEGKLDIELLSRGYSWLDTGTYHSLQQASSYVQAIQERQGLKIACIEEIAYRLGYINEDKLEKLAVNMNTNEYSEYLLDILKKETTHTNTNVSKAY